MRRAVFLFLVALAGCATQEKFRAMMDSWVNQSEGHLVERLGPPASIYAIDGNTKILTYVRTGQIVLPGQTYNTAVTTNTYGQYNGNPYNAQSTTYVPQQGAPMVIQQSCTVNFKIVGQVVSSWTANGNACTSR